MRPKNSRDDQDPIRSRGARVDDQRLVSVTGGRSSQSSAITRTPILGRGSGTGPWGVGKWLSSTPKSSHRPSLGRRFDAGLSVSPPLVDRQGLHHLSRQTPTITPILRKLEALVPQFCQAMTERRFLKCCTVLGSILLSAPPSSGPRPRTSNSPVMSLLGGTASPSSRASPGRSPIRAWLTGAGGGDITRNDSSNSLDELHTATMLESNMEVFFLLLGVESMYTSMAHVMSPQFAQILASSYEQALKDLQLLRFSLCDAFHVRPEMDNETRQPLSESKTKSSPSVEDSVKDLASSILLLISFCQARVQCIHLQSALWHQRSHPTTSSPNFAELGTAFASIAPATRLDLVKEKHATTSTSSSWPTPVETLLLRTLDEIHAWSGLCRTTFAVQHCHFAESILAAQSTKLSLQQLGKASTTPKDPKKASCLELWLQDTLRAIVGTFPIVFDKATAFAKPLYGFEVDMDVAPTTTTASTKPDDMPSLARNNTVSDSFETDVMDALHKHERVGAISIAVVLDAVRTSNQRVESGFAPFDRTPVEATTDADTSCRKQYPAIYIRTLSSMAPTSFESGSPRPSPSSSTGGRKSPSLPSSESGLLSVGRVMRRENSRKGRFDNATTSPRTPTSNRKVFRSWSTDDSNQKLSSYTTPPSLQKGGTNKAMYALEYGAADGPETSNQSWPHSEWTTLVAAITDNNNSNNNSHNKNNKNNNNGDLDDVENLRGISLFGKQSVLPYQGLDARTVASGPCVSYGQQSIHCIESISDSMWLVAILKDLDQPTGRWHWQSPRRPTTESIEDDLRDLVSNLASMLRISDRFDAPSVRLVRDKFLERSSDDEIGAGLAEELNERGTDLTEMGTEKIAIWIKNQLKVLAQSNSSANATSLGTTSRLLRRKLRRRGTKPNQAGHAESAAAFFLGKDLMHTIVFDFY